MAINNVPEKLNMRNSRIRISIWLFTLLIVITWIRTTAIPLIVPGPTWNNLTLGISTRTDVIQELGAPNLIKQNILTGHQYLYFDELRYENYRQIKQKVVIKNNRVVRIYLDYTFYSQQVGPENVFGLIDLYGNPTETFIELDDEMMAYYWFEDGIYAEAFPDEDGRLFTIVYFLPCAKFNRLACLIREYSLNSPPVLPEG
jgi:hypothetical protein